jgi:glycosyltransferase involved in cell wall biosynthesis
MSAPLRVLCLDIEGGYGGSSRSLFESLLHMDRNAVAPEVWCRRDGPARSWYAGIGVPCRIEPAMPRVSSLPRLSRNLRAYAEFARAFFHAKPFRARLAGEGKRFDLVHFNHEGLFLLARWLRRHLDRALTMHIRTMLAPSAFARWQARVIARVADRCAFITENEQRRMSALAGATLPGAVINNIARAPNGVGCDPDVPQDGRLAVAVLSNYAWVRGVDRVVDIAERLAARGSRDVRFVVAGDMRLRGTLPGRLGQLAREHKTLADFARERDVGDYFLFLGHVDRPETVLAAAHALIKPSREDNPWGRDIIEALAAGRPVLAVGSYDRFVNGETGHLLPEFDADRAAEVLLAWARDRALPARLGAAGARRVGELCNGPARAADLLGLWRNTVASHGRPAA